MSKENILRDVPEEQPEKVTEQPSEDPRDIARAMLMDGASNEDVIEETGLPKRTVWGLKGALARAGKIPTRKEEEMRELVGVEARAPGEEVPFRREKSAPELIVEICNKYGVKKRATRIIADRCKRVPGGVLHPSDFERLLMDLDSGLKKREAMLIAEEYDLALERERTEAEELGRRGYYVGSRTIDRGRPYYREEEEEYYRGRYGLKYDRYGRRLPPEYGYGRPEVTRHDLEDMERRITEMWQRRKEEDRLDKMLSIIEGHGQDIATIATELKNIKENPPMPPQPEGESDYVKALKHTIDRQDKRMEEVIKDMKESSREWRELIRTERKEHKEELKELEKEVENVKRASRSGEGYRSDELRLASEGMHRLADVFEKKEPVKIVIEGAKRLVSEEEKAPKREKMGETGVEIPDEYLE